MGCLAILAKAPFFNQIQIALAKFFLHTSRQQQRFMYSASFSMKMLVAKLAQMGNFCLAKSDVMWPMAQMATGSVGLADQSRWLTVSPRLTEQLTRISHFYNTF